jgi:hypothetical protein
MAKMADEPFRRLAPSDSASDVALRHRFRTLWFGHSERSGGASMRRINK